VLFLSVEISLEVPLLRLCHLYRWTETASLFVYRLSFTIKRFEILAVQLTITDRGVTFGRVNYACRICYVVAHLWISSDEEASIWEILVFSIFILFLVVYVYPL